MRLAGKIAIISGAASGMGAATARLFAREGAKVVVADVLEHEGRQVADAIGAVMARNASRAKFPRRSDLSQRGQGSRRPLLNRDNAVPRPRTYRAMAPPST